MQESSSSLLIWLDQFILTARVTANHICRNQFGLELDQIRLLRIIAENPDQSVSWVVRQSYLDRTAVSRALSMFVKRKLIERTISPEDARQFLLKVTPAGKKLVQEANRARETTELRALSVLTDDERRNFEQCLAKLCKLTPEDFDRFEKAGKAAAKGS